MIKTVLLLLIYFLSLTINTVPPSYHCQLSYGYCTLTGITVTKERPEFTINFSSSHPIEAIQIEDSFIPLLTSQICDTFPDIVTLNLNNVGIEVIEKDALKKCTSLKGFQSWNNPLQTLDTHTFNHTVELRHLSITNSSIKELPEHVFDHLRQLRHLSLVNNHLSFDNPLVYKNLNKLEVLELYSNELLDLDDQAFVTYLPNLKKIYLNDNDFLCDRLVQIIEVFKNKGVLVDSTIKVLRDRTVTVGNEEGNICIASQEDYLKIIETKTKKGEIPPLSSHHRVLS